MSSKSSERLLKNAEKGSFQYFNLLLFSITKLPLIIIVIAKYYYIKLKDNKVVVKKELKAMTYFSTGNSKKYFGI